MFAESAGRGLFIFNKLFGNIADLMKKKKSIL